MSARKLAADVAKKLINVIIKDPSTDRTDNYLVCNTSTARILWSCQEIIENAEDWKISKLHRELGIILGIMIARNSTSEERVNRKRETLALETAFRSFVCESKSTEIRDE